MNKTLLACAAGAMLYASPLLANVPEELATSPWEEPPIEQGIEEVVEQVEEEATEQDGTPLGWIVLGLAAGLSITFIGVGVTAEAQGSQGYSRPSTMHYNPRTNRINWGNYSR